MQWKNKNYKNIYTEETGEGEEALLFLFFYSGLFTLNVLFTLLSIFIYLVIFCSADIYEQLFRKII